MPDRSDQYEYPPSIATAPIARLMIPEPRYVSTTPIAIPAMSDPEPRPRSAKRRICVQSMREKGGAVVRPRPVRSALRREARRRPQPAGQPLEDPLAHVLEELRLVVARGGLGLVLAALQARRAESLGTLERANGRRELRRRELRDADLVHHLHGRQHLAPRDDDPRVGCELRLVQLQERLVERLRRGIGLVGGERRRDAVDPRCEVA